MYLCMYLFLFLFFVINQISSIYILLKMLSPLVNLQPGAQLAAFDPGFDCIFEANTQGSHSVRTDPFHITEICNVTGLEFDAESAELGALVFVLVFLSLKYLN